jgi:hypothetical protein
VITAVAYLIVANDPRCSHQSVQDFIVVISSGFKLVDTSNRAFIQFFTLLQTILSTQFVIQLYCELFNYEENVSMKIIEQSTRYFVKTEDEFISWKSSRLLLCISSFYDGKLLLNNSERRFI